MAQLAQGIQAQHTDYRIVSLNLRWHTDCLAKRLMGTVATLPTEILGTATTRKSGFTCQQVGLDVDDAERTSNLTLAAKTTSWLELGGLSLGFGLGIVVTKMPLAT